MKSLLRNIGLMMLAGALLVACEEDPDNEMNLREEYLGTWNVNETTGWNAPQFYKVEITEGTADDEIVIAGLYNIADTRVKAVVDGNQLTIPSQSTEEINFSGDGQANADFDQITLDFTANDGSGPDEVKAVLTR